MGNKGLLFIPDISGFTKFVSETEIEHSRLIIQELLEILIDANDSGLEISEIEGDAILFYKFGDPPHPEDLYRQVEHMFCAFHRALNAYDLRKYCQCKACTSAIDLSLKVITHYGEFTDYKVKNFSKLIGKDVIVAHQLLKNDIENHEYWLITCSLLPDGNPENLASRMTWRNGDKEAGSGKISFQYTWLSPLRKGLPTEPVPMAELSDKAKVLSLSREYETDIITLFHASGDFNYRSNWQEDVSSVEEINHYLPRVGMRCRYIMDNGDVIVYTSNYYRYQEDKIEFSETDERGNSVYWFTLEKTGEASSRLTLDLYLNSATAIILKQSEQKKIRDTLNKSLQNLDDVVKAISSEQ